MDYKPDFLVTPYILVEDKEINKLDERVYSVIYYFTKMRGERCVASNKTIAEIAKSSPSSVANSLSRLIKKGYVHGVYEDEDRKTRKELVPMVVMWKIEKTDTENLSPDLSTGFHSQVKPFHPQVTGFHPQVKGVSPTGEQISKRISKRISNTTPPAAFADGGKQDKPKNTPSRSDTKRSNATFSAGGAEIIHAFLTNGINQTASQWYNRPPVRAACDRLIDQHGKDEVLRVVQFLEVTNQTEYFPVITTPQELEKKWATLESATKRKWKKRVEQASTADLGALSRQKLAEQQS